MAKACTFDMLIDEVERNTVETEKCGKAVAAVRADVMENRAEVVFNRCLIWIVAANMSIDTSSYRPITFAFFAIAAIMLVHSLLIAARASGLRKAQGGLDGTDH